MSQGKRQALGSIFGAATRGAPLKASSQAISPAPALPAAVAGFLSVVDRVEAVLDAEIEALTDDVAADIAELGNRKRQGLLEMSRALRSARDAGPPPEVRERLARFAAKLERNRAVLGAQLRAVREIAEIIAHTLREAESDGTYSPAAGRA